MAISIYKRFLANQPLFLRKKSQGSQGPEHLYFPCKFIPNGMFPSRQKVCFSFPLRVLFASVPARMYGEESSPGLRNSSFSLTRRCHREYWITRCEEKQTPTQGLSHFFQNWVRREREIIPAKWRRSQKKRKRDSMVLHFMHTCRAGFAGICLQFPLSDGKEHFIAGLQSNC